MGCLPPTDRQGLYDPRNEHDACGVGMVAHIKGAKSHAIVTQALEILANLDHRGAVGADPLLGDGAGILVQIPDPLVRRWADRRGRGAAPAGRLRRRHVFPAAAGRGTRFRRASARTVRRKGRPARTRLARRADHARRPRQGGDRFDARDPPMRDRARAELLRSGGLRTQAGGDPQADPQPARRARGKARYSRPVDRLYSELLEPHAGLQGAAARQPGGQLLRRSARSRLRFSARPRPPAVQHQHLPQLAAGASLSLHGAQWRDQHRSRQCELDGSPPPDDGERAARRRSRQDVAADPARPVGHRLPRQCARAAGHRRLQPGACDDDADARGLGQESADGSGPAGVLRISCRTDGAVGRPGGGLLYRWAPDRRLPRSQRAAPGALVHDQGRSRRARLGKRRAAVRRCRHHPQMAAPAGTHAADRSRPGPHRRGRGTQGRSRRGASLRGMAREGAVQARGSRPYRTRTVRDSADHHLAARTPAGLRLHAGGHRALPRADGPRRRGSDRVDGHRHADRRALRPQPPALRLFQAEFRAGHQSADRSDPRRIGDEPAVDDRSAPQSARPRRRHAQAARGQPADPHQRSPGQDPLGRGGARRRVPDRDHRCHLGCRDRRRRARHGAQGNVLGGDRSGAARCQHPGPVGSRTGTRSHPHARAARHRRGPPPARPPGAADADRPRHRDRRSTRGPSFLRAGGLWRGGDQSLSRLRDARGTARGAVPRARSRRSAGALRQGGRQGHPQGHVQDGHLDLPVLLRSADLRRGGPVEQLRRCLFHRHRDDDRGHRPGRSRRRGGAPPRAGLWRRSALCRHARRRRNLSISHPRRGARLDSAFGRHAAACGARQRPAQLRGIRAQRSTNSPNGC